MRHDMPGGRAIGLLIVFSALLCFQTSATGQIPDSNWQKADMQSFTKIDVGDGLQKAEQKVSKSDINAELRSFLSGRSAKAAAKNTAIASGIASILASQPGFSGSQFTVKNVHVDKAGNTHVILSQQRDGIPVEGATVSLHINSSGEVYDITGVANTVSISVHPTIDSTSAVKRIEAHFSQGVFFERQPSLVIYGNRLVFSARVRVPGEYGAWEMRVDANSGEILARITTIRQVDPPGYPLQGQTHTITGNILPREGGASVTIMGWRSDNTNPATYYLYNNAEHWKTLDNVGQLYDSIAWQWGTNNRIAISGAYNIEKTQAFSLDSLGRNSWDNAGRMVPVRIVNGVAGSWNGTTITVGTGDAANFDALACIDVIAHEFGHALTDGVANLNYSYNESGALNEAYSDITGTCVEFAIQPDGRYAYNSTVQRSLAGFADWLVGEDVCLQGGNPWWLRNMRDPLNHEGLEGKHPSLYRGTAWDAGGEMHFNSTVGSHCFYLISEGA